MIDPEYLRDLFSSFGPIGIRRMFGGQGLYADDLMFGLVADGEIYLRADSLSEAAFAEEGSRPFTYPMRDRLAVLPYWRLPETALDDPDAVAIWARLAREAALRNRRPKKPPVAKKRARPS